MPRIIVLGAGFGGLELSAALSSALGENADIVLIDKGEGFVFGFSKLDVMFAKRLPAEVFCPYRDIKKPGQCHSPDGRGGSLRRRPGRGRRFPDHRPVARNRRCGHLRRTRNVLPRVRP